MYSLNYTHLLSFWMLARAGGVARAADRLQVTHSTVSSQIKALEAALGVSLVERRGRRLVLTSEGEAVALRADEVFRLGAQIRDVASARGGRRGPQLRVGVVSELPRSLVYGLLDPALQADGSVVFVRQERLDALLDELIEGRLHLLLSDAAPSEVHRRRVVSHLLGRTRVALYAAPALARRMPGAFPHCLMDAPMLLPAPGAALHVGLSQWLSERRVRVRIQGEFDDAAMLRLFGFKGHGVFPVRVTQAEEVEQEGHAVRLGLCEDLVASHYAVTVDRKVRHPTAARLIEAARARLEPE